jgi:hypothetical protein
MVDWLAALYRKRTETGARYIRYADIRSGQAGDFAKLKHWGLIEADPTRQGYWTHTSLGVAFLQGKHSVPRYLHIVNDKVKEESEEQVTVHDAYRAHFSMAEVMGWTTV